MHIWVLVEKGWGRWEWEQAFPSPTSCAGVQRGGPRHRCTLLSLEEHLAKEAEWEPKWSLTCPPTSCELWSELSLPTGKPFFPSFLKKSIVAH